MYSIPHWLNVSRETEQKLQDFTALVLRWNDTINLISKQSMPNVWHRHILDSAQIFPHAIQNGPWLDLGSGAGFPGIVMAIMGARQMTLVESDQRKAAFLREAGRVLDLDITVVSKRIEALAPQHAGIITARALASLTQLLSHANTHLCHNGCAFFPKGLRNDLEILQAEQTWRFDYTSIPSKTDPEAVILVVKNIQKR